MIVIISQIILTALYAQPLNSVCNLSQAKIVNQYTPRVEPKYFFKPVGTAGNEITYVGFNPKSGEDENYIFNTKTGNTVHIPGRLDPIGLFGHDLVSVPLDDSKGGLRMAFYDVRELRVTEEKTAPLLPPDASLSGRYQSLGVLSKVGTKTRFRVFTDGKGGGEFRDYEVDFATRPAKLRPVSASKVICKEKRDTSGFLNLKLPMISKDGQRFSAFDINSQEMKLFNLNSNGSCTDAGVKFGSGDIGKLDFSPDHKKVAFHFSDRDLELSPMAFGAPEVRWSLKGTVYDLNTKSYSLLPYGGKNSNAYYPAFLPNGNVMVLQMHKPEVGEAVFQYVEIDLKGAPTIPAQQIERLRALSKEDFAPYLWLSEEWIKRCSTAMGRSLRVNRLLSVLSLSQRQCESLLDEAQNKPDAMLSKKIKSACSAIK